MRYTRFFICLLTLFLAVLGIAAYSAEEKQEETPVSFSIAVNSGEGMETIACWENAEQIVYAFLPGYADMSDAYFQLDEGSEVRIDGQIVTDGSSCAVFQTDKEYGLSVRSGRTVWERRLVFTRTGQMPAMYIDVRSGSMAFIHMDKENKEPGTMRLYDTDGTLLYDGALETVKGRGNSSWGAEKKPYNLLFPEDTDLLGMGSARRWVLIAEGFQSSINIRNKLVYDFAHKADVPFSPESRWVELYLNGEYAGLYLLCERNEVHENRVDIAGDGHFLVSLEFEYRLQESGYPYVRTDSGQALRIHSAAVDSRELDNIWQTLENALLAEDGRDPVSGKHWKDLIDMDSWARKYLLEEMFGNGDGGSLSQYFFRCGDSADKKIYAGPVWDYDMAMGGYDIWLKNYTNYFVMDRSEKEKGYSNPWFQALYRRAEFRELVELLYEREFLPLMQQLYTTELDSCITQTASSFIADGIRWGVSEDKIGRELTYIREFLRERTAFLTDVWVHHMPYHVVQVDTGRAVMYGYFAVKPGECLPELPEYESIGGAGWFVVGTDEPFDVTQPIYEDVQIYVKIPEFQIPKIHYIPFAALLAGIAGLAAVNHYRNKKNRRQKHDAA